MVQGNAREKARGGQDVHPAPVKIFTEIIGNWRKVKIFNRIEKIPAVKQQRGWSGVSVWEKAENHGYL